MTDDKPNELTLPVASVRALTRPHNVQVELLWLEEKLDYSLFRDFTSPDRAIEAAWYVEGLTDGHAAALDAVHRALAVTPLRPSERDVHLAELQAMYRAFRPQNIANPREAAQHISNLRAFDAQQEEQIAQLKARVAGLEVELAERRASDADVRQLTHYCYVSERAAEDE